MKNSHNANQSLWMKNMIKKSTPIHFQKINKKLILPINSVKSKSNKNLTTLMGSNWKLLNLHN